MKLRLVFIVFCYLLLNLKAHATPGENVEFIELNPFNNRTHPDWGVVLTDIAQHSQNWPGDL